MRQITSSPPLPPAPSVSPVMGRGKKRGEYGQGNQRFVRPGLPVGLVPLCHFPLRGSPPLPPRKGGECIRGKQGFIPFCLRFASLPIANCLLLIALCLLPLAALAQTTSQTSFGKNRVQYHRQFDDWLLYESSNFVTYWYGDARNIAQSAVQTAELDFPEIQQLLEHQMTEKIEMIVFSDITDVKQSNIGEDEVFQLRSGETKVVGSKIFVYFDGDHQHLQVQIREGMAAVLLNSMLFGSNLQEIVQNAVLLNLPGWYTSGLTAYCGEEWSPQLDNELRDLLLTGRYTSFDKLARSHPRVAGHALWHYIGLHFGRSMVSNLLYLTRINRSVDAGFLYVLGSGYRRTTDAMLDYFNQRYVDETRFMRTPDATAQVAIKNKKNLPLTQLKISPDGQRIAYVSNDIGKWRVWIQNLQTGERTQAMRSGSRNALQAADYNYPLLAWNPDNQRLTVLYERRDILHLAAYDVTTKKKEIYPFPSEYQRVYSLEHTNPAELLLSAAVKGYTDLFLYRTINRQSERLTQDFWDDLDASVVQLDGHRQVLFASNRVADTLSLQRLDTILPLGHFDVFLFDLEVRSAQLQRITNTPYADERQPIGVDSAHFGYLSDESGVVNRQAGYLEPYTAYYQTNFYLQDDIVVKSLDMTRTGEWPLEQALALLAPADTVVLNLDSTKIDSVCSFAVFKKRPRVWNQTNYDRNIVGQTLSMRTGKMVEIVPRNGKTAFFTKQTDPLTVAPVRITRYRELMLRNASLPIPSQPVIEERLSPSSTGQVPVERPRSDEPNLSDTARLVQPGWYFQVPDHLALPAPDARKEQQPEVPRPPQQPDDNPVTIIRMDADSMQLAPRRPRALERSRVEFGKNGSIIRFNPAQIIPYRLRFRTDYISTTMDNNQLFEGLERYDGPQDRLRTPPPGVLIKANFKDLLEDYVVEAGFRLPTTFNGAEYYLWFDNKKRRLDRRILFYRRTQVNNVPREQPSSPVLPPDYSERTNTILGQYEIRYPLDVFTSLRMTAGLRQDKTIALSSDLPTLEKSDLAEQRASLRLAGVYDNTVGIDLNLKTGTRAKVYVEAVKSFDLNTEPNLSLKFNSGFMTIVGLDARHYQMLDRRSQIAVRLAGATSFGSEKMLYVLGGVDNWIFPKFETGISLPSGDEFAYQTLASNLRGFKQNIRNGNSFALLNTELRVPIFKYFSQKPVLGNFWRNFQLIGFFDVGSAWQGISPYQGNNPINTVYLYNPPTVTIKVNYFRDPLVAGYGVGVRTLLFGLYIRADYAWGVETRVIQKPMFHLALGTDF